MFKVGLYLFLTIVGLPYASAADRKEWPCDRVLNVQSLNSIQKKIQKRVESALASGKIPVLLFDLDDTLFHHNSRYYFYLLQAQQRFGFSLFDNLDVGYYRPKRYEEWLEYYLRDHGYTKPEARELFDKVRSFVSALKRAPEVVLYDSPMKAIVQLATEFQKRGAHIVAVTSRDEDVAMTSIQAASNVGLHLDGFVSFYASIALRYSSIEEFKAGAVHSICQNPRYECISFFEDKLKVVEAVAERNPKLLSVHIHHRQSGYEVFELPTR